jgi:hypothetical protein
MKLGRDTGAARRPATANLRFFHEFTRALNLTQIKS